MATDRLVVVSPNWLGDAVMALPAFADLRRHYPSAHVAVAARASVAPLFAMVAGVDEVITLPGRGGVRALTSWQQDAAALAGGGFDAAVLLPNSFAAGLAASRSGIAERWGFATDWRDRFLTRAVPKPAGTLHQGAYYQALTTALGIAPGPLHARVWPDVEWARQILREIGLDLDEPFAVFAPGAAYGRAKQWLPSRFAELARMLAAEQMSTVLVGAGGDKAACQEVAALAPAIDLSGRTDLATLAGLLSSADHAVVNDSGAMHLAAAVGAPVTAIFGPTNDEKTSPLRAHAEAPPAVVVKTSVWCRPCMLRECPIDHRCMTGITADQVRREMGGPNPR